MRPYFADLFAGSKRVARAARRLGVEARTWEIEDGPENDLTDWQGEKALHEDIEAGRVLGASLGLRPSLPLGDRCPLRALRLILQLAVFQVEDFVFCTELRCRVG